MIDTQTPDNWLRKMIYGYAGFEKWRVLMETAHFAIVQCPGERYMSGQTSQYGPTTYHLVYKYGECRQGHGSSCWTDLRKGGRVGARIRRQWQAILEECERYR